MTLTRRVLPILGLALWVLTGSGLPGAPPARHDVTLSPFAARTQTHLTPVAAARAIGPAFRLPRMDRAIEVDYLVTTDVDRDGDLDAVAATPDGQLLIWNNVGSNRLVRTAPAKKRPASRANLRIPRAPTSAAIGLIDQASPWLRMGQAGIGIPLAGTRARPMASTAPPAAPALGVVATRGPPPSLSILL